jgi:hypothetical protein
LPAKQGTPTHGRGNSFDTPSRGFPRKSHEVIMKSSKSFVTLVALLIALQQSVIHAFAQPTTPRDSTWITNGNVTAVAYAKGLIYIGGDFTFVGPNTGHGAAVSTTTGVPNVKFPRVNGPIYAVTADGADGWYIGGRFTKVGDFTRNGLAHIKADGTVNPNWDPNVSGSFNNFIATNINAIAVSGSTVYIGGNFTSVGGQPRRGLAALNAATGQVTSWNPNASNIVNALAVKGQTVYAGGDFTSIGGKSRQSLAAIDIATGDVTAWYPGPGNRVLAMIISDTSVFVGGDRRLTAYGTNSGRATAFNVSVKGAIYALTISGTTLYAGGGFSFIGGKSRNNIAAFSIYSSTPLSWNPGTEVLVLAMCAKGATVYVGGYFSRIGGQPRYLLAALDGITGKATDWISNGHTPHGHLPVRALAINRNGSVLYVGGSFRSIGGQPRNRLAALNAQTGMATHWNPNVTVNGSIYAIAANGSNVYIGGAFTMAGSSERNRLAAFDATTGALTAWNPHVNGEVHALTIDNTTVYAGGKFTVIGSQTRNRLAAIDMNTGQLKNWNPNVGGSAVYTILTSGNMVYAGGDFFKVGDFSSQALAAIDATTGLVTAWNPNLNASSIVYATARDGATLYFGGEFNTVKGQTRNRLAAVDLSTANPTAWNPNANGTVRALAVNEANVYAGGAFTSIGAQARNFLAAINKSTGIPTGWNPTPNNYGSGPAQGLLAVGPAIWAGGAFTTMEGRMQDYFAQFGNAVVPNNPPNAPIAVNQFNQQDNTAIPEGSTINANLFVFKATISDPNNEPVKFQIELRKITEAFSGVPTHESSPANSGTAVSIATDTLAAAKYKWRYRVMDVLGSATTWVEFGTPGNTDFVINTIPLPAGAAYGNIPGGDQTHPNEVTYVFPGRGGHLHLSFQIYDMDTPDEVRILLNGANVGNAPLTADNQWSGNLGVFLPDALVNNDIPNLVIFDNVKNPPAGLQWGVRQVSLRSCYKLPASAAYGKIPGGSQANADRVIYWFPGQAGDMNLFYEVYDINDTNEVDIILNDAKIHDEAATAKNGWSTVRTRLLPDALVNDTEANVIIFDNTKNPPDLATWGVRNASVARIAVNTPLAAPTALKQLRADGTTVIPEGGAINENKAVFTGTAADPDGKQVKLQIELRKMIETFTGAPNLQSRLVNSGTPAAIAAENLIPANYKWRFRAMNENGLVSAWGEFGSSGNIDFVVNQPPNAPTAVNQFSSNGATAIPEGGNTNESKAVFKATITDLNNGQVKLQIELRKTTEAFTGTPNLQSSLVNSGTTATVAAANLDSASYKWRYRAMDARGLANAWAEFGTPGNTDFTVNATHRPPNAPTAVNQFSSNGTTAIPEGGTTNESKVVFKAAITDPDNDQSKLQIELRKTTEAFTGVSNLQSSLVNSGTPATIVAANLDSASYKWRFRAMDANGLASAWAEFGTPSNTDFTVISPLPPGVPVYPSAASSQIVGDEFGVEVYVGTNTKPVTKLFGLAFVLAFTQTDYIDVVTPYDNSIMPLIEFLSPRVSHQMVDEEAGKVSIGMSRAHGDPNVNGYGAVLRVRFVSRYDTPAGTQVKFSISNVAAFDSLGNPIALVAGPEKNITLNPSPTRTVWPGDTNNDRVVNPADILPLGLYWGATGPIRPNASMQFIGQPCPTWAQPLATYADANGDGKIDQVDVVPIGMHWGKRYTAPSLADSSGLEKASTPASGTIAPEIIPLEPALDQEFFMRIKVAAASSLFGLSFELLYDQPQLLQVLAVESDSLFGNDVVFYSNVDAANGKIAVGISRKAGQASVNRAGSVVRVKAKIAATATVGTKINFSLQNVTANDAKGAAMSLSPQAASLTISNITGIDSDGETSAPASYRLLQNHPNPFNAGTLIKYEIPQAGPVSVKIYNLAGQETLELVNAVQQPGRYQINWNGRDSHGKTLPSGVYICRIQAGSFVQAQRMIMVR